MPTRAKKAVQTEKRPWGFYEVLLREPGIQLKRIEVHAGRRFSLQKHNRRSEKWVVIAGRGVATLGRKKFTVKKGSFFDIPCGSIHRLYNSGPKPLVLIEVQFGSYLEEDDIVRLEDDFGRC